jgi:hypothetical protein
VPGEYNVLWPRREAGTGCCRPQHWQETVVGTSPDLIHPNSHPSLQCPVFRYDEEEWATLIADPASNWSRAETDYLIDMVETFDQRFIVIADRWDVSS